nr:MAG TPA: hypothetical protein [Caudoviricetes sp.]
MAHERRSAADRHAQQVALVDIGFMAKLRKRGADGVHIIESPEEPDQVSIALGAQGPERHAGGKVGKGRLVHSWPHRLVWDGCILSTTRPACQPGVTHKLQTDDGGRHAPPPGSGIEASAVSSRVGLRPSPRSSGRHPRGHRTAREIPF